MATETGFIQFAEGSAPSTPASTKWRIYFKTDGMYYIEDDGTEVGPLAAASAGASGNLWTMSKNNTSQTLTSNTLTQITFEDATIDGGGGVIDLANDRFVAPATGLYTVICTWLWEATSPTGAGAYISVKVGSTESIPLIRPPGACAASQGLNGSAAVALTMGDFVTMWCHPGGAVTPTARGNASIHLRTTFTLVRIT